MKNKTWSERIKQYCCDTFMAKHACMHLKLLQTLSRNEVFLGLYPKRKNTFIYLYGKLGYSCKFWWYQQTQTVLRFMCKRCISDAPLQWERCGIRISQSYKKSPTQDAVWSEHTSPLALLKPDEHLGQRRYFSWDLEYPTIQKHKGGQGWDGVGWGWGGVGAAVAKEKER